MGAPQNAARPQDAGLCTPYYRSTSILKPPVEEIQTYEQRGKQKDIHNFPPFVFTDFSLLCYNYNMKIYLFLYISGHKL